MRRYRQTVTKEESEELRRYLDEFGRAAKIASDMATRRVFDEDGFYRVEKALELLNMGNYCRALLNSVRYYVDREEDFSQPPPPEARSIHLPESVDEYTAALKKAMQESERITHGAAISRALSAAARRERFGRT